jgi:hypothetical protein
VSERHYAVEVGGDFGGVGSAAAAAFDQVCCVEVVERVGDGELLLCLVGAEGLA